MTSHLTLRSALEARGREIGSTLQFPHEIGERLGKDFALNGSAGNLQRPQRPATTKAEKAVRAIGKAIHQLKRWRNAQALRQALEAVARSAGTKT